jgi:hypothetical protein
MHGFSSYTKEVKRKRLPGEWLHQLNDERLEGCNVDVRLGYLVNEKTLILVKCWLECWFTNSFMSMIIG